MSYFLKVLFIFVFINQETDLVLAVRKFVYQKDMSEYCRRRVMPSVFLGRQVVDAYSQILHFSRLELPYSCFISVRTESGSNIILVIQLASNKTLIESCRESKNQLLVYELGETFGGYWGALPNRVMDTSPKEDENQYTIKTTQPTTTARTKPKTLEPITATPRKTKTNNEKKPVIRTNEYFLEVPIVNVSIELVPGRLPQKTFFNTEDTFDKVVDVKPWPNVTYKTKVLPLLQFSLEDKGTRGALRTSAAHAAADAAAATVEPETPAFHINFNPNIFTPDYRLPYPVFNFPTKRPHYKYNVDHRLDFKKNKKMLAEKKSLFYKTSLRMFQYPTSVSRAHEIFTSHRATSQSPLRRKQVHKSWDAVKDILKNLNRTDSKSKMHKDVESLLRGLAIVGLNKTGTSTGLAPNVSSNVRHPATTAWHSTTKYKTDAITWRPPSATYRTNYLDDEVEETTHVTNKTGHLLPVLDVDTVILNVTQSKNKLPSALNDAVAATAGGNDTFTSFSTATMEKPLTLLDHESWENMVHAASLMQVVLNQSVTPRADIDTLGGDADVTISKLSSSTLRRRRRRRKKRFIHAIPINHMKPHRLPVKIDIPTSTPYSDRISNAQEFQRFIELQDDEMHDRVALRYLRHYIGPVIFNICDFDEVGARHVYLFNSSRLVISISNFTLERMTVVITPARTLLSSDAHCPSTNLECQVSGARVCIDSLSACDGVPNCGSYDIYDEDRLMCGRSAGLQHNVCLAAITFLAVLLTLLYIVHYWLKRCVPKVSDAFFIYTDAAENVLYLEPIMRSPYDTGDAANYFYRGGGIPDYMQCPDMTVKRKPVSSYITRFLPLRLFRWRCRRKRNAAPVEKEQECDIDFDHQQMFSYDEVEFNKFGVATMSDTAVQTGSSLMKIQTLGSTVVRDRSSEFDFEMKDIVTHYEGKRRLTGIDNVELQARESRQRESEELSILNFFKRARSVSVDMRPIEGRRSIDYLTLISPPKEEEELQSLDYDPSLVLRPSITSVTTDISIKKLEHSNVQKKLRFEEITAVSHSENDNVEDLATERKRRSVAYGSGKNVQLERSDSAGHDDEPSTSTNKKGYFWGSSKNKPKKVTKKKTQLLPNLKF